MTSWRVFTGWRAIQHPEFGMWVMPEACQEFGSWPEARRHAMRTTCLNGTRYVSVQDPGDVVVAEYDSYTGVWRQYPKTLVDVDHTTEITTLTLAAFPANVSAWCTCGWSRFELHNSDTAATRKARDRIDAMAAEHRADPGNQ